MPYRYKLIIEFDGADYVGWQRQNNGPSIQAALEDAVYLFCGDRISAVGAGRTDAGVHALGMAAHIDLSKDQEADVVRDAINHHLKPAPISVLTTEKINDDFHARFSSTGRHYQYRLINRRSPLTLEAGRAWRISGKLNTGAMNAGGQYLVGKHDFSAFRAAQCQSASPVKTLSEISCTRYGDHIEVCVSAPSFLHHQVRSIAGSLVQVGLGKWSPEKIREILESADRAECGPVAPACGLYFVKSDYPGEDG